MYMNRQNPKPSAFPIEILDFFFDWESSKVESTEGIFSTSPVVNLEPSSFRIPSGIHVLKSI